MQTLWERICISVSEVTIASHASGTMSCQCLGICFVKGWLMKVPLALGVSRAALANFLHPQQ